MAERYRDVPLRIDVLVAGVLMAAALLVLWLVSRWWEPPWSVATTPLSVIAGLRLVGRYYYRRGYAD